MTARSTDGADELRGKLQACPWWRRTPRLEAWRSRRNWTWGVSQEPGGHQGPGHLPHLSLCLLPGGFFRNLAPAGCLGCTDLLLPCVEEGSFPGGPRRPHSRGPHLSVSWTFPESREVMRTVSDPSCAPQSQAVPGRVTKRRCLGVGRMGCGQWIHLLLKSPASFLLFLFLFGYWGLSPSMLKY